MHKDRKWKVKEKDGKAEGGVESLESCMEKGGCKGRNMGDQNRKIREQNGKAGEQVGKVWTAAPEREEKKSEQDEGLRAGRKS